MPGERLHIKENRTRPTAVFGDFKEVMGQFRSAGIFPEKTGVESDDLRANNSRLYFYRIAFQIAGQRLTGKDLSNVINLSYAGDPKMQPAPSVLQELEPYTPYVIKALTVNPHVRSDAFAAQAETRKERMGLT